MSERASTPLLSRLLRPFAEVRQGEAVTALLMFAYAFLAMTSYNIIQPITRSKFIADLGAENIPYVQFAAGFLIGLIMQGYSRATALLPRKWVIPVSQAVLVGIIVGFWALFQTGQQWVSAAFYLLGLIFAILLISQFWTLANTVYDARQAKRLFGFIGGGTVLGGMTGAGITALIAERIGTNSLLLFSAGVLALCIGIVVAVLSREGAVMTASIGTDDEQGLGGREALKLFLKSRQMQLIAVIITMGAFGAAILDQQLNMATEEFKGRGQVDSMTAFLGAVRFYLSAAGLVIQMFLTSRIHRLLGVGFALMVLPVSLGLMAGVILANAALWAPALGSVVDRSFRYTVDKTTREILFLPLPTDVKLQAKPFVDVTVDRMAKGVGALILLVLIKPWGLNLTWQQLSFATLALVAVWGVMAMRAKREYIASFRRSIEQQQVRPSEIRLDTADLNTIETLVFELSHPDPRRVIYAIDLLESLDKRHLVTPLLLHHESPDVRARALAAAAGAASRQALHWTQGAERALKDPDGKVRLAAVRALAVMRREDAPEMMRPFLQDSDPLMAITAASALAIHGSDEDRAAAEETLRLLASDTREQAISTRLEVARVLGELQDARYRTVLVPLMFDPSIDVAREAIQSAGKFPAGDFLFVPPLISLMRHRLLKKFARQVLVGYGEEVIDALAYFMRDKDEDIWIRRHVPSTLALIPSQRSLDVLVTALADDDGFIRYKAAAGIDRIRRERPDLRFDNAVIERQILQEAMRAFSGVTLHHNLFVLGGLDRQSLLARALEEKHRRARGRIFRLLGMLHPPDDIAAVRTTLGQADARLRAGALEYLDNLLAGDVRRRVMLLLEEMPEEERIRRGNTLFKTRVRDVEDTLAQLVHDDEEVIAAAAIQVVEQRGMWSLADDLEHVLEQRDPRDWVVFEAASWALAARRLSPERRRALWLEPLPAVELADRLRRIQLFNFASVNELFRIAGLGRQVRHESGRVLYETGRAPESLQFLLDGQVTVDDDQPRTIQAPAVLAFENVLEGSPVRATVRASETAICLSLTSEEFLSLLSENVEIAQGIFRLLIETGGASFETTAPAPGERVEWQSVLHGRISSELEHRLAADIQPVDLVLLLQTSPLLARATSAQLVALASVARPIALKPGADPLVGFEPSILVVLSGSVRVERDGHPAETADAGDTIGIAETLGGFAFASRAEVMKEGQGVRFTRSDLFDLLADNIDLLQGIFSGLLRARAPRVAA
jgi:ATP/ADP translocase/HEAT repeat protein/CRP-like cAMP-binding protein